MLGHGHSRLGNTTENCVDLKKMNRKQMYDQLKRRYNSQRKKFTALFKILLKKTKCKKNITLIQKYGLKLIESINNTKVSISCQMDNYKIIVLIDFISFR